MECKSVPGETDREDIDLDIALNFPNKSPDIEFISQTIPSTPAV